MALNIRNPEAEQLASELAARTGLSKTDAVIQAVRQHLNRLKQERGGRTLADELDEIAMSCAALPDLDRRTPDEVLGYDENGLPS